VVATNQALSAEVRALLEAPARPSLPATLSLKVPMTTVVTQHARTGEVLMVAQTDQQALDCTLATGEMHYRSRTRGLWHKGATSGNAQKVESLHFDCDGDALLARVVPAGPACHTTDRTCFHDAPAAEPLGVLDAVIDARAAIRGASYTQQLLANRNLRLKKLGEEATELVMALADGDSQRCAEEAADLVYHLLVALRAQGLGLDDVRATLHARHLAAQEKKQ
jgi:phosphoribosyl-ATP pyrophosphohydrolase/phosphoribosyl-AMP cyclohydrolase